MAQPTIRVSLDIRGWKELGVKTRQLAIDLPEERRAMLQGMRETIEGAIRDQYTGYPAGSGRPLPPAFNGNWGQGLRVWVQPQMGAVSVRNMAIHGGFVETGRPPGPVPQAVITEWAQRKLGIEDPKIIRRIWKGIMRRGYRGMHVIARGTSPYSGEAGGSLHVAVGSMLKQRYDRLYRNHGWG